MSKVADKDTANVPLEGLVLECTKDKYKLAYAAIRWAKEIRQKENLPDPLPVVLTRALREILTGKITIKEVEKLPVIARVIAPIPQVPSTPTLTLNTSAVDEPIEKEEKKKSKEDKED